MALPEYCSSVSVPPEEFDLPEPALPFRDTQTERKYILYWWSDSEDIPAERTMSMMSVASTNWKQSRVSLWPEQERVAPGRRNSVAWACQSAQGITFFL